MNREKNLVLYKNQKQLLNNLLDEHVELMPKPKWPQSVYMPVTTDRPITDYEDGDELIYWPN